MVSLLTSAPNAPAPMIQVGARQGRGCLEQLVDEVVARGLGAAVMQLHLPLRAGILARAPRDDEHRIPGVIEGTLYGDHPVLELERPEAFPALAHDHAHAV